MSHTNGPWFSFVKFGFKDDSYAVMQFEQHDLPFDAILCWQLHDSLVPQFEHFIFFCF